jgi:hypothetical protein
MKKAHSKYLFTLCVILLSFLTQLVSRTQTDAALSFSKSNIEHYQNVQVNHNLTNFSISEFPNNSERLVFDYDEECEDEKDFFSSPTKSLGNCYLSSFFHPLFQKYFLLNFTKVSQVWTYSQLFPSNKLFIVFGVFRI